MFFYLIYLYFKILGYVIVGALFYGLFRFMLSFVIGDD